MELAVMGFLAAVPSFVIALQGITDPTSVDLDIGVLELVASLLASLGPAAMAVYLLWRDGRLSAAGFDRRPVRFVAGYGALGLVSCFIALYAVLVVLAIVLAATGADPTPVGDDTAYDLTFGTVVAGLALALTAGVGEEIVFRAYAITRMEEAGFRRAAIWVPWAAFTAVHLYQGPVALLAIGAVGGVFVWLYRWRQSIWPVMVAHALYDVTILLIVVAITGS